MAVTRKLLSSSTNGRPIKVAATASAGTTIHQAVTGTSDVDEIWLFATNTTTSDVTLTIEFGGTTSPDDTIKRTLRPNEGPVLVVPGLCLNNGSVVRAFASSANVVTVAGYANRISPS